LEWEAAGADTFIPTSRNRVSAASGRGDVALEAAVVATEWRLMRFHSVRRSGICGMCCARTSNNYNGTRTHLALAKDSPLTRSVQTIGRILPLPILGGLHHR
jgi:hypothetical protein